MLGLSFTYRIAKKLVGWLPTSLLRLRPFGVYEILLKESVAEPVAMPLPRRDTRGSLDCQVRWVADRAEADLLRHLAKSESIDALDFTTRCVAAAWLDGQAIACAWIGRETFEERELGLQFELQPTEVWLFAAVVDPALRDQGVYRQLLTFLVDELGRRDFRRILLGVTVGNEPSRRAHVRQGATKVGAITAARCLGFNICRRAGRVRLLSPRAMAWRRPIRLAVDP